MPARNFLHRRAEDVAVAMLAAMFLAFILQIVSRYVIREPLGWTLEACLMAWLWLVFWGGAFLIKDQEHVRFEILYGAVRPSVRKIFALIAALVLALAFFGALPATYDFISFMKIERSSTLGIRLDYVFAVYLLFAAAVIVRYLVRALVVMRGQDPDTMPPASNEAETS